MALIEINHNPSRRELGWFGAIFALFFALVGVIVFFKFKAETTAIVIWCAAAGVTFLYVLIPRSRRALYLGWMYAAFPIGWTVSHVILGITFYLVMTPIGLIMRLVGRDPMERRFDPDAKSYWAKHDPESDPKRYFKQF